MRPCKAIWEVGVCDMAPFCQHSGVSVSEDSTIKFASWVESSCGFGSYATASVRIADSFESELHGRWCLGVKATSRFVTSPHHESEKWPCVSFANVLGRLRSDDTSPLPCWKRTYKHMWVSFRKTAGGTDSWFVLPAEM